MTDFHLQIHITIGASWKVFYCLLIEAALGDTGPAVDPELLVSILDNQYTIYANIGPVMDNPWPLGQQNSIILEIPHPEGGYHRLIQHRDIDHCLEACRNNGGAQGNVEDGSEDIH